MQVKNTLRLEFSVHLFYKKRYFISIKQTIRIVVVDYFKLIIIAKAITIRVLSVK